MWMWPFFQNIHCPVLDLLPVMTREDKRPPWGRRVTWMAQALWQSVWLQLTFWQHVRQSSVGSWPCLSATIKSKLVKEWLLYSELSISVLIPLQYAYLPCKISSTMTNLILVSQWEITENMYYSLAPCMAQSSQNPRNLPKWDYLFFPGVWYSTLSLTQGSYTPCISLNEKSTWSVFCSNKAPSHGFLDGSWELEGHRKAKPALEA